MALLGGMRQAVTRQQLHLLPLTHQRAITTSAAQAAAYGGYGGDQESKIDFGFQDVPREEKANLVAQVFSSVASSYDVMNDLMSGGMHRLWKDRLVSMLRPFPGQHHLDVAGGTGDVGMRVLRAIRLAELEAARIGSGPPSRTRSAAAASGGSGSGVSGGNSFSGANSSSSSGSNKSSVSAAAPVPSTGAFTTEVQETGGGRPGSLLVGGGNGAAMSQPAEAGVSAGSSVGSSMSGQVGSGGDSIGDSSSSDFSNSSSSSAGASTIGAVSSSGTFFTEVHETGSGRPGSLLVGCGSAPTPAGHDDVASPGAHPKGKKKKKAGKGDVAATAAGVPPTLQWPPAPPPVEASDPLASRSTATAVADVAAPQLQPAGTIESTGGNGTAHVNVTPQLNTSAQIGEGGQVTALHVGGGSGDQSTFGASAAVHGSSSGSTAGSSSSTMSGRDAGGGGGGNGAAKGSGSSSNGSSSRGPGSVTVCDINAQMLLTGRQRAATNDLAGDPGLNWVQGDAETLPFEDESFDSYTIAFGIRNVTDRDAALRDALRVLKRGGRFLCLEFSTVNTPLLRQLYDTYSFNVIPKVGGLVANDEASYQYLVESIRKFPDQETFACMIEDAGFRSVTYENLMDGVVAIHSGFKL